MLTKISGDRIPLLLHRHSKLSDDKLDKIEDIADDALKGVVSSSALPLLTGLGVGFGIAGFSGIPIVGMAAAGYFLYNAAETVPLCGAALTIPRLSRSRARATRRPASA